MYIHIGMDHGWQHQFRPFAGQWIQVNMFKQLRRASFPVMPDISQSAAVVLYRQLPRDLERGMEACGGWRMG